MKEQIKRQMHECHVKTKEGWVKTNRLTAKMNCPECSEYSRSGEAQEKSDSIKKEN